VGEKEKEPREKTQSAEFSDIKQQSSTNERKEMGQKRGAQSMGGWKGGKAGKIVNRSKERRVVSMGIIKTALVAAQESGVMRPGRGRKGRVKGPARAEPAGQKKSLKPPKKETRNRPKQGGEEWGVTIQRRRVPERWQVLRNNSLGGRFPTCRKAPGGRKFT